MRKIARNKLIFGIALSILLTACGSAAESSDPEDTQESVATEVPSPTEVDAPTEMPDPTEEPADDDSVIIIVLEDSRFTTPQISIPVGSTVRWVHEGARPHTVTSDDGLFDAGTLATGGTFEFTFTEAGTFSYYCQFHGGAAGVGMSGVIEVTE